LRKDDLCSVPKLCPEAPDDDTRCEQCPLARLEAALAGPMGESLHRVVDLDFALRAGFTVTLDEVDADDFRALQILHAERENWERERLNRK
jgi:hypothetical protein